MVKTRKRRVIRDYPANVSRDWEQKFLYLCLDRYGIPPWVPPKLKTRRNGMIRVTWKWKEQVK